MPACRSKCSPPLLRVAALAALSALAVAATLPLPARMLDLNGNGISDVWEAEHPGAAANPGADPDGDGVPNRLEAIAGTDPFDAHSVPRITSLTVSTNGVRVMMPGIAGKHYELETSEGIAGANSSTWTAAAGLVARTNATVTLTAPADRPMKFFRVVVSDVDTDGDGLTDWEEYQLGLDPLSAYSNGQLDRNGRPMNDYQYITNRLASQSLASLLAAGVKIAPARASRAAAGGAPALASVAVYPSVMSAGTGLTGEYFTNSSAVYSNSVNFNPANLFLTTNDAVIDFSWGPATSPNLSNTFCTVRWTGQVEPQYSETYVFETRTDDGVKLWVNDQLLIDKWQPQGTTSWTNTLALQAGVRYDIRMEYLNLAGRAAAHLYWYSPSQPRQIIPSSQLYPASGGALPGGVTSPANAVAFLGQAFSYTITGANSPLGYGATNLPPGLSLNPATGTITGIPALAGTYAVSLSVTNALGVSTAVLDLQVLDTGSAVSREVWLRAPGSSVADIPVQLPPSATNSLGTLEGIQNFGDNYGERIRGYLTAPVTGNYYFWIAASSSAELWISDDDEPVNKVRRAYVTKAVAPRQWNLRPGQRSAWLSLVAGRSYYIEILHKAGKGPNDHWSVAWLQDPYGTNTVPAGVVPGYVLSPYVPPAPSQIPGTLYAANMLALPGVGSTAVGSATLRVAPDGSQATLIFQVSNLSSPITSEHLDADAYLNNPSQLIFDISAAEPGPDGSYVWDITPQGTLTAADILEIIRDGKASINLHTVNFPAGEISGNFTLAAGAPDFAPPPPPPSWKDDHSNPDAAARFLTQATFGPTAADVRSVRSLGYAGWIRSQFKRRISGHLTNVLAYAHADPNALYSGPTTFNTWWQQSVTAPDQLRQRVAFALSEIMVVSENGVLSGNARALSSYYDILLKNAFGNYRDLLKDVTLSPAMGMFLDMVGNDKGNLAMGTHPNENYAREVMQLFSIGLNRMWPDGTLVLNSQGNLVPTYDQDVIIGYARTFTGWNYYQTNQSNKRLPVNWYPGANYTNAMVLVPTHHELGTKLLLDNAMLPAAQGAQADPSTTNFDAYCSQDLEQGLDSIFLNPNAGPFICRQLIQRLVTSHPSRDYLYRVVQKFEDNGSGVRGDMKAVIEAILLDYEARSPALLAEPAYGKQREPLLRATALARALPAPPPMTGIYHQKGTQVITITTPRPHLLGYGDSIPLDFHGNLAPNSQVYSYPGVSNATTFTIIAQGLITGFYTQTGAVLTLNVFGHGLSAGNPVYLVFTSGGAPSGLYTVATVPSSSAFTVAAPDSVSRFGNCLFPEWTGGQFTQSGNTITFTTTGATGLTPGSQVYIQFPPGTPSPDGTYRVAGVHGPATFTVASSTSTNFSGSSPTLLPLKAPPLHRSGTVRLRYNTWNMGYTDGGSGSSLSQTPLDSPTVFNYFFPDYKFPGALASAGLTTPEFQLTSDTGVVLQMNFLSTGIFSDGSNTNGISSFVGGSGAIVLDLVPWMDPKYTADAGIPALVDGLNTLLCAGRLTPDAKSVIVSYVANDTRFPYTTPTAAQRRDRARAVLHMIVSSPDFTIQR